MDLISNLKLLEKSTFNSDPSKEKVPFRFITKGYDNQDIQIVKEDDESSLNKDCLKEFTTISYGLDPLLDEDLKSILENRYLKPKPILGNRVLHYSISNNDRKPDSEQIFMKENPRNLSFFQMKRDSVNGKVVFDEYSEMFLDENHLNSKNSVSLTRQPTKFQDFVRGKSSNLPFLPGGLDQSSVLEPHSKEGLEHKQQQIFEFLNFNNEDALLTTPPGFEHGMSFDAEPSSRVQVNKQMDDINNSMKELNIKDIMKDINDIVGEMIEFDEEVEQSDVKDEYNATNKKDKDDKEPGSSNIEEIDDLLPKNIQMVQPIKQIKKPIQREWAHMIDVNQPFPDFYELVPDMTFQYPFELDVFQKQAVYHLERGDSVFVAAHTSAGKTVVAEYAIALAKKHMTRAIYTSPIKALSNQKFRDFKQTFEDVGILTGDVQINPEASCLIMTTEILRSMLYRGADLIRDVEFVIFDEVHYVNDAERGVVWEEVIIMLPSHVNLILLSATVPNTKEFADWVGRTKKRDIYVISTPKRPTPLEHYLYADKEIYKIVDSNKNYLSLGWKQANDALTKSSSKDIKSSKDNGRGGSHAGRGRGNRSGGSQAFSSYKPPTTRGVQQTKCDEYANGLSNIDLTSGASEKSEIHLFCEKSLQRLKGTDRELPQVLRMRELLGRGIAVHHAGLLPIIKEMVEILFTRGLVKILFATETFAMGVNAPARAVVFSRLKKHDGTQLRELLPGEYTQMSGRAGRRGLDSTGLVLIVCEDEAPEPTGLTKMILGTPTKLESRFRLTYNMILSLLRVEALKIEDMIKRSFSENLTQKLLPEQEKKLEESSKKLDSLQKLDCVICVPNIYEYYEACLRYLSLTFDLRSKIMASPIGAKSLTIGRVVVINNMYYRNVLGVIAQSGSSALSKISSYHGREDATRTYQVLILYDKSQLNAKDPQSMAPIPPTRINQPLRSDMIAATITVPVTDILLIFNQTIKFQSITKDEFSVLTNLYDLCEQINSTHELLEYDWSKIRELEFQEKYQERNSLVSYLNTFQCNQCPDFIKHIHFEQQLEQQIAELSHLISDQNLELLPDYNQRVQVLKALQFIDVNSAVTLKGRVACEINTADELILTELILDNFFAEFDAAETVALLSCFVFQEKSQNEPTLTQHLIEGIECMKKTCVRLAEIQKTCGLDVTPDSALSGLKFGLVEVVYEWAKGMSFKQITDLTDVPEGSIVRCIIRLEETCRELKGAARLMGDPNLFIKMEEAQHSIKRDIVFAASLYF